MSELLVDELRSASSQTISVAPGSVLSARTDAPGSILQTVYVSTPRRATYSAPPSGSGTRVSLLTLRLAPLRVGSLIVLTWVVNGEMHHDTNFVLQSNSSLLTSGSYAGVNLTLGDVRSSGYASGHYDRNEDSTPANWTIMAFDTVASLSARSYDLAVRSSSSGSYTFALNRTLNGSTGDAYESMVSSAMAQEVAQ